MNKLERAFVIAIVGVFVISFLSMMLLMWLAQRDNETCGKKPSPSHTSSVCSIGSTGCTGGIVCPQKLPSVGPPPAR